jgi:hypothetical protein
MLASVLIAVSATACGGSGGEERSVEQILADLWKASRGKPPPTGTFKIVSAAVADASHTLNQKLEKIPEDEREQYKRAACAALNTIESGGQPDWETLVSSFGLSSPSYEFRRVTEDLQRRAEAGAPFPNFALQGFIDYACI